MTRKQFQKFLDRDKHCFHCGSTGDDLVPNHRANRGMGGSKVRERSSNVVVLCSLLNGLIESDALAAQEARSYGWKIDTWQDPLRTPVFDKSLGQWFLFDDLFGSVVVKDLQA